MAESPVAFAAFLFQARDARRLSVRRAAAALGKTHGYYSQLERTRGRPSVSDATLDRLAEVLGVDRDALYLLAGRVPPDARPLTAEECRVVRAYRGLSRRARARWDADAQRTLRRGLIERGTRGSVGR